MDSKLKERLKKIQALAERGVGGEAETAKKKLDKLLSENDMTQADLNADSVHYYLFSYSGGKYKYKLLAQIIYRVVGVENFKIYKSKHTRNKIGLYCTPSQKLEIDLDFEFYCNLFESEMELFLEAFIAKQDIFPKDVPTTTLDVTELTPEEKERMKRKQLFEDGVTKRTRSYGMLEEELNE